MHVIDQLQEFRSAAGADHFAEAEQHIAIYVLEMMLDHADQVGGIEVPWRLDS